MNSQTKLDVLQARIEEYKNGLENYNDKIHTKKVVAELDRMLNIIRRDK